jgi:hypothetical protein
VGRSRCVSRPVTTRLSWYQPDQFVSAPPHHLRSPSQTFDSDGEGVR